MNNIDRQRSEIINSALEYINKTTILYKQHLGDDPNLQELSDYVEQYCVQDINFSAFNKALESTENAYKDTENTPEEPINKTLEEIRSKIKVNTSKNAISKHPYMLQFIRETEKIEIEKEVETDGDIVATNDFSPPIDPITKTAITNPVRNIQCGHVYENDPIRELIKKKSTRCPYIGCPANRYVQLSDLKLDHQLKKKIDNYLFKNC